MKNNLKFEVLKLTKEKIDYDKKVNALIKFKCHYPCDGYEPDFDASEDCDKAPPCKHVTGYWYGDKEGCDLDYY